MSFVAKVFVVLNLIMSVFFLGLVMFEWTALTKWQRMYEIEKGRNVEFLAKTAEIQKRDAQAVVRAQEREVDAKKSKTSADLELAKVHDEILIERTKSMKLENELKLAMVERDEVTHQKDRAQDALLKAKSAITKQQQALQVERNNATQYKDEKVRLENDLNQTNGTLSQANRDLHKAQQELQAMNNKMDDMVRRFPEALLLGPDDAGQPLIEGKVLAVRPDVGLVMLSVGNQQNVKPGYKFTISKGPDYIGKVQIDKVYDTMCSARILGPLTNKAGLPFEANEDARTR